MNVIQYRWVVNCAEFGTLVELEPLYMIYSNADLLRYFEQNIDKYGDHYTSPVAPNRLREIFDAVDDQKAE
jgi:hypothetical protein